MLALVSATTYANIVRAYVGKIGNIKWNWLHFQEKQFERRRFRVFPQPGGSFEIMWEMNRETGAKQSLFHDEGQALLSYDNKAFQRKKLSWGHLLSSSRLKEKGLAFLSLLDKLDSIVESEFFDKMRASSLRFVLNKEESTWLNHSRFIASLSSCIHECFVK